MNKQKGMKKETKLVSDLTFTLLRKQSKYVPAPANS